MTGNVKRTEEENREIIRHDLDKNLFIEAGAGAGKTTLLVDRAVERLCTGDVRPSQIVIITFTNAAASELYNRIVTRLRDLEKSDQTDPEKKKIITASLKHIDQMTISTIHHFCNAMLQQRVFDAQLGMDSTYTEEDEMLERKEQYIRDALSGKGKPTEIKKDIREELDHLKKVLGWNYKNYIENLFCDSNMADREDAVYKVDEDVLGKDWGSYLTEMHDLLEKVNDKINYYSYEIPISVDTTGHTFKGLYNLYLAMPLKEQDGEIPEHDEFGFYKNGDLDVLKSLRKALKRWNRDQTYVVTALNKIKEGEKSTDSHNNVVYKNDTNFFVKAIPKPFSKGEDTESKEEKKEIAAKRTAFTKVSKEAAKEISDLLHDHDRLADLKKRIEAYQAGTAVRFVEKLSGQYQEEREPKYISNDTLLYRTRDLLKNEQARKILADRYRYLFVDEYQDTDQVQTDIIWNLCRKEENPDQLRDGSLVIVGDPKQSIYRFRGADSTLFETMKEKFEKLQEDDPAHNEVIALHYNYRSNEEIINQVNDGFKDRYTEPAYEEMQASSAKTNVSYPDQTLHGIFQFQHEYEKGENNVATKSLNEENYRKAPGDIIQTLTEGNYQIMELKDGVYQPRKIRYSDFLVLTWSKFRIPDIVNDLKERDIPVNVLGSVDVQISPVERLVRIVEYLANPNDNVAEAAAAQAIYGRLICDISKEDYKKITRELENFRTLLKSTQTNDLIEEIEPEKQLKDKKKNQKSTAKDEAKNRRKKMIEQNGLYDLSELVRHKDACAIVRYLVNHEEILFDPSTRLSPVIYYDQKKQLHNLVESMESQGIYDLNEAAQYLEDYFDGTMEHDKEAELVPDKDQVRVMNLHKAKGLQAPIVILMERKREGKKNTFQKKNEIYMVAKSGQRKGGELATYAYADDGILAEIGAADLQDIVNLQYVADTRAGEALIFVKKAVNKKEQVDEQTDTLSKDADDLTDTVRIQTDKGNNQSKDHNPEVTEITAEKIAAQNKKDYEEHKELSKGLYRSIIPSDFENAQTSSGNDEEERVEKEERPTGAVFGTVMHRCFELFVNRRETILNEKDSSESIQKIISQAVMENISDIEEKDVEKYQKYLTRVLTSFRYNNEKMDQIRNAKEVYTEFPFSYYKDKNECEALLKDLEDAVNAGSKSKWDSLGIDKDATEKFYIHGACDLVLKNQNNSITIIDYKSDECHIADHKAFKDKKELTYGGQLTLYRYAMAEVFGVSPKKDDKEVTTELYLVDVES